MDRPFEFPFEREAMRGEIPSGLSLTDAGACLRLIEIYRKFREAAGRDDARRRAKMEKDGLRREWAFDKELTRHHVAVTKATEILKAQVRKNPTPENALALCDALDGIFEDSEIVRELTDMSLWG